MKLNAILLAASLAALSGQSETTISDVVVRQQWPWKTQVNVDFLVGGSTGAVTQVTLAAYQGDSFLGYVPPTACSGGTVITSNGQNRIVFDPAAVDFLVAKGPMNDFRLDVAARDVPSEEVLYKIFDLRKLPGEEGQVQYVTEFDLTNGVWGAWERDYWGEDMARTVIWTGVTNDAKYATSHLVVRRIPAGTFTYGTAEDSPAYAANDIAPVQVTISKPYYMGVFEFTVAQFVQLTNRTVDVSERSRQPSNYKSYGRNNAVDDLRGTAAAWPTVEDGVGASTIIGRLRARTGVDGFDLPTEAQWEMAARAGSTGVYYSSTGDTLNSEAVGKIARAAQSTGNTYTNAGNFRPNAYGLYDTLGNAWEMVLDWYEANHEPDASDPKGPETGTQRVLKGGYYYTKVSGSTQNLHLSLRTGAALNTASGRSTQYGYRVCCPAQ